MKIRFETTECGRCGGTGHHDYNQLHGSMCYGCSGSTRAYTRAGAVARDAYDALIEERCTKLVGDVQVGEEIWMQADVGMFGIPPQFPRSGYYEVARSEQDPRNPGHWSVGFTPHPKSGEPRGCGFFKGAKVRVYNREALLQIMKEVAAQYEGATLLATDEAETAYVEAQNAADAKARDKREKRQERAERARQEKAQAAQAEQGAKHAAERNAWREANPALAAYADSINGGTRSGSKLAADLASKAAARGLTPKQTDLLGKLAAEAEEASASTHFGRVGDKVTITATVKGHRPIGTSGPRNVTKYLVTMTEQSTGAVLKTFTTGGWVYDVENGDTITFSAVIEKHGEFQGRCETVVKDVRTKNKK